AAGAGADDGANGNVDDEGRLRDAHSLAAGKAWSLALRWRAHAPKESGESPVPHLLNVKAGPRPSMGRPAPAISCSQLQKDARQPSFTAAQLWLRLNMSGKGRAGIEHARGCLGAGGCGRYRAGSRRVPGAGARARCRRATSRSTAEPVARLPFQALGGRNV